MKSFFNTFIISIAIIISVYIVTNTYTNRTNSKNIISVTGLGEKDFISDLIVWRGSFTRKSFDLQTAYQNLKNDRQQIKKYLIEKKVNEKNIVFSSVDINKEFNYLYDKNGLRESAFTGYRLTQRVEIESKEVDKIENISREITDLINLGVEFNSFDPDYYYTELAKLKIEMIASASKDARIRAEKIAENSGTEIIGLKNARMGVFQITAQNSNEDYTWGGVYNTSTKRKTARITMKLQFGIK